MGVWAESGRDIAFLIEYDTGSEHLLQLAGKLTGYAGLARHPACLAFRMPILFCFPTPRREQAARKALAATATSGDLQIATAAINPRLTCPACGPTWMTLHGGHGPMRLTDLDDVLPDPWRAARAAGERREQKRRDLAGSGWPPDSPPDDEPDAPL